MRSTLTLLSAAVIAGVASAQTGPGIIKKDYQSPVFEKTNFDKIKHSKPVVTGMYIQQATRFYLAQISAIKLRTDPAGKWTVALTVYGLHPNFGNTSQNTGGDFVVMGKYDRTKETSSPTTAFAPSTKGNAMNNPAAGNFGLMIGGPLGRYAVVDWSSGPMFSKRATPVMPFPKPVAIGGISNQYVDPAVAFLNGKLMLFWVDSYTSNGLNRTRIMMAELDHSGFSQTPPVVKITGTPVKVADVVRQSSTGTVSVHSPTPVVDRSGVVHGLSVAERVGNDSDHYFKSDLLMDKGHGQQLVLDNTAWLNNGAVMGGTFYMADSEATRTPFYQAISQQDGAWICSATLAPGATSSVIGGVKDVNKGANSTILFMSDKLIPGVKLPNPPFNWNGKLGLNVGPVWIVLGAMTHSDATEESSFAIVVPNDPKLKGISAPIQGLSLDPGTNLTVTWTNTGFVNIR